jgi:hypothetical protein
MEVSSQLHAAASSPVGEEARSSPDLVVIAANGMMVVQHIHTGLSKVTKLIKEYKANKDSLGVEPEGSTPLIPEPAIGNDSGLLPHIFHPHNLFS